MGIRLLEARTAPATLRWGGQGHTWGSVQGGAQGKPPPSLNPPRRRCQNLLQGLLQYRLQGPSLGLLIHVAGVRLVSAFVMSSQVKRCGWNAPGESPAGSGMAGDTQWEGSGALESGHNQL